MYANTKNLFEKFMKLLLLKVTNDLDPLVSVFFYFVISFIIKKLIFVIA